MKIRGLLLGTAAAVVAATGARAADAIIIAEPEPMEYVRICDVYGAGFFYIPGTQNCLKIGGYVRYEMQYSDADWTDGPVTHSYRFSKLARFAPTFDVRSETEWGTLRAFAEVEFDWNSFTWDGDAGDGAAQSTNLNHAFIELQMGAGSLLIGKTDNPYARFFDYGADGAMDGDYGGAIFNSGEVSYTFNGGNGFSAVLALVEPQTGLFEPNVEGGIKFEQDWGSVGAIVGYDNPSNTWGAKGVARVSFDPVSLGAQVYYNSSSVGAGTYGATHPYAGVLSQWSVLGHASVQATEIISVNGYVQWFDGIAGVSDAWQVKGGLVITPIADLEILPEVRYTTASGQADGWEALLRFNRNF